MGPRNYNPEISSRTETPATAEIAAMYGADAYNPEERRVREANAARNIIYRSTISAEAVQGSAPLHRVEQSIPETQRVQELLAQVAEISQLLEDQRNNYTSAA